VSFRAATGAVLVAALLLTESCGGGAPPPRAARTTANGEIDLTHGARSNSEEPAAEDAASALGAAAIKFEDLPVTRLDKSRVPRPNAANPSLGAPGAPVVVQLWSDFECPFCANMHPVLTQLLRAYAGKVRLVWHDYPLPFHAHARLAANAGREAYAQAGATGFWKFHDAVYGSPNAELDASNLERFAAQAGLDAARFRDSLTSLRHNGEIDQDQHVGDSVGVEGTPAFLINDYFFVGAVPLEIMRVVVDRALSDAGA
jgi:protein-disulfide isomerase